ncbi:MAG: tetraacyldisaccharide 4'-kinase [Planctomycetota bacterium]
MSGRPDLRLAERGGWIECLRAPAMLFGAIARARGFLYSRGVLPSFDVGTPVVSVGNLVAGGTGKTPMIVWLARELAANGRVVGLVSRGYRGAGEDLDGGGAASDSTSGDGARNGNDEARMLADMLPGVLHIQDRDRVDAARRLADAGVDVILMDDGFQHRRLSRDLDVVLVDALRPYGLPAPSGGGAPVEAFLPRGLLREPLTALRRAHAVVLTRTDAVSQADVSALETRIQRAAPGVPIARSEHRPTGLRVLDGDSTASSLALAELVGRDVDLFSGIGNPGAFEETVRALGASIVEHRAFGDHHGFSSADLAGLGGARPALTTAKDAARLRLQSTVEAPDPLWVLDVELSLTSGGDALRSLLASLPESAASRVRGSIHEGLHG